MIHSYAQESTSPLLERVLEQKINLAPIAGSPLALLVEDSLNPQVALVADEIDSKEINVEVIADFTRLSVLGENPECEDLHQHQLESIAESVANSVRITMDTARNKVNPVVLHIVENIQREFKENVYNYGVNVELKFVDQAPLLAHEGFMSMVSHDAATKEIREIKATNAFHSLSNEALIGYLKTNVDSIDADVAKWYTTVGEQSLAQAFRYTFGHNGAGSASNIYHGLRDDLDYAIAVYLLARGFAADDDVVNHVEDISLSELRASLAEIKAAAAFAINVQKSRFENTKARGMLVHSYPARQAEVTHSGKNVEVLQVYVHRAQFDEFVQQGGNVDMIYGNILESDRAYKLEDVLANGKVTERRWESHSLMLRNKADSRKFEVFKRAIISGMAQWIRDQDDFALGLDQLVAETRTLVGGLNYSHMTAIYETVLAIVDQVLFLNSDAVKFLRIMNKYHSEQPALDMRHIATLAATEYTANWVSSMILAEK